MSLSVLSDHDKYICTVRSQSRGRADLIITDITSGQSNVIPLRWRQLVMLGYESMKALDMWPLVENNHNNIGQRDTNGKGEEVVGSLQENVSG